MCHGRFLSYYASANDGDALASILLDNLEACSRQQRDLTLVVDGVVLRLRAEDETTMAKWAVALSTFLPGTGANSTAQHQEQEQDQDQKQKQSPFH